MSQEESLVNGQNGEDGDHREEAENVENETHEAEQELRQRKIAPTAKVNGETASTPPPDDQTMSPSSLSNNPIKSSIDLEGSVQKENPRREKTVPPSPRGKTFLDFVRDDELKAKTKKQIDSSPKDTPKPEVRKGKKMSIWLAKEALCTIGIISFVVLFAFLVVVLLPNYFKSKTDNTLKQNGSVKPWIESQKFFEKRIRYFMNKGFVSQKQETWVQILSAVNSTLSEREPKQPSAIVLLTPPALGRNFITCFSKKLAGAINDAHLKRNKTSTERSMGKEIDPKYFDNHETVTDIHDDLKQYLQKHKAVVVYDVDQIRRENHLLIFHAFCDSSQAYDKRATYLFVLPVPEDVYKQYEWNHHNGEDIAQQVLNTAWGESLSQDKRPALISRILANIVVINEGDVCEL